VTGWNAQTVAGRPGWRDRPARDAQGRFVSKTTREGQHLEGATSIYADCFVIYGISEYCRAEQPELLRRDEHDHGGGCGTAD
jgi:mannose/cellobiose epimerase-like protein (N-acyl-D-glucosamine 2-epimerase family)